MSLVLGLVVLCLIAGCWLIRACVNANAKWSAQAERRQMERLRVLGDDQWSDDELIVDEFEKWFALPSAPNPQWRLR